MLQQEILKDMLQKKIKEDDKMDTTNKKKSVKIRERKEALMQQKKENMGELGAAKAKLLNVPTSPRKMRLVIDQIRGKKADEALNILKVSEKHASISVKNLLQTVIADWELKNENISLEDANLYIKEAFVDSAKMIKRLRPAPKGRGHRIRKRSNHVTIVIDSKTDSNISNDNIKTT